MHFEPFAFVALLATATAAFLLGKIWNGREARATEELLASARGEIGSLKRLIARRDAEREGSGIRRCG